LKILNMQKTSKKKKGHLKKKRKREKNGLRLGKNTIPELKMKNILKSLKLPFEHQYSLEGYSFDFHLSNTNILIEVDGDYWHGNPKKFQKLNRRQERNRQRDLIKDRVAKDSGFILLRFWEDDILNNGRKVIGELKKAYGK
jgi:very-short-patch-repair endonuclease